MKAPVAERLCGVGLGLRWAFIDAIAAGAAPEIPFFEIAPENYLARGGHIGDALARVAARRPLLAHGLMLDLGGADPFPAPLLADLRAFLADLRAPWHSDHLCWSAAAGVCLHDLLPLTPAPGLLPHLVDRIHELQDRLGLPLAVENITYYGAPGCAPGPDLARRARDLLCDVLDRADCALLLDVNNVLCNAENHGFDPEDELRALPLDRVVHLHIAGGERLPAHGGLLIDTHGAPPPPRVLDLLRSVITRTGPRPVVYERDHNIPDLPLLQAELAHITCAYDQAVAAWRAALPSSASPRAEAPAGPLLRPIELSEGAPPSAPSPAGAPSLTPDDPAAHAAAHAAHAAHADLQRRFAAALLAPAPPAPDPDPDPLLAVYRRLVRGGLRRLLRDLLPRLARHLGPHADPLLDAWLAERGPRSRLVRALPGEFVDWLLARPLPPGLPPSLLDLARLERLEHEVRAAPPHRDPPGARPEFDLHAPLVFDASARLTVLAHEVHLLPRDDDDADDEDATHGLPQETPDTPATDNLSKETLTPPAERAALSARAAAAAERDASGGGPPRLPGGAADWNRGAGAAPARDPSPPRPRPASAPEARPAPSHPRLLAQDNRPAPIDLPRAPPSPLARRVALLTYRGPDHEPHHLDLSPFAEALLARLLAGTPAALALPALAADLAEPLDRLLPRAARLLADLAERGVLRGAAPA